MTYINFPDSPSINTIFSYGSSSFTWDGDKWVGLSPYTVWHSGNDGTGSGLDADLLDGLSASSASSPSTIVSRDTSGSFAANTIRTNSILDSSGGNTATINSIPLRPGVLDPDNRIINGAFDIWQRGTTSSTSAYGPADRWINVFVGGTVTQSRQSFALGDTLGVNNPKYFLRQTVSGQSLTTDFAGISQRVEGVTTYAGQTITILGWARRFSGSGNMTVAVAQNFGTGGSPSTTTYATIPVNTITLSTTWQPFAITFTMPSVTGKTLGTAGNDFVEFSLYPSLGTGYGGTGTQTIAADIWGIHIKVGTHSTDTTNLYKQPELGPELMRCQRYYAKSYNVTVNPGSVTTEGQLEWWAAGTNANHLLNVPLPVSMRAPPTTTVYSGATGNSGVMRNVSAGTNVAATTQAGGNRSLTIVVNNVSITNSFIAAHFTADAEL